MKEVWYLSFGRIIICVGEVFVDDYFDNKKYFYNEKDMELFYFDYDFLFVDLEFSVKIFDMECYKEIFIVCVERKWLWIICYFIRIYLLLLERICCYLWFLLYGISFLELY